MYSLHHIQAFSKPNSEQECNKDHEPYALHKKIRSKECSLSGDISAIEEKFEWLLNGFKIVTEMCSSLSLQVL